VTETTIKRKYDITIDGYSIRTQADFDRVDLSKAQRRREHRAAKLAKRTEARAHTEGLTYSI